MQNYQDEFHNHSSQTVNVTWCQCKCVCVNKWAKNGPLSSSVCTPKVHRFVHKQMMLSIEYDERFKYEWRKKREWKETRRKNRAQAKIVATAWMFTQNISLQNYRFVSFLNFGHFQMVSMWTLKKIKCLFFSILLNESFNNIFHSFISIDNKIQRIKIYISNVYI